MAVGQAEGMVSHSAQGYGLLRCCYVVLAQGFILGKRPSQMYEDLHHACTVYTVHADQ